MRGAALLLLLAACAPRAAEHAGPLVPAPADSAAIHALSRDFSAAYVRGDAAAMAALYTEDGVIFPERSAAIAGQDAIRAYWTLGEGARITRHEAVPTEIRVDRDLAYDHGTYEIAGERDGTAWGPSRGKYVIVWRRERGGPWRIHLDMWNAAAPAASR